MACALMVACRLTSASFLVPFGAWVLLRDPRRAALIVGVAALAFAPWAWAYAATYGTPFGPSMSFASGRLWTSEPLVPLMGVLISPSRGLLVYQAWIALAPLMLLSRFRASTPSLPMPAGWPIFAASAIAAHVLLISAWGSWWGGWCWGSRLVVDIVPLCALLCVRPIAVLWDLQWGRALVVTLALLGIAAQLPGVYCDPTRWNAHLNLPDDLWSWSRPPFLEFLRD